MRLRKVKNASILLQNSSYFISCPTSYKGHWQDVFSNSNPIHLEIGCGKGKFLMEMAQKYPNLNFVGMEYEESVLVRAIQRVQDLEIPNLRFICYDAFLIREVFQKEVAVLYLNFSDPWPKKRHAKRRLTSPHFLQEYETIFENDKTIIQKTDNLDLFGYSLESFSQCGYILEKISFDLAKEDIDNIPTEYEEKFMNLGYKINYVKAIKKSSF